MSKTVLRRNHPREGLPPDVPSCESGTRAAGNGQAGCGPNEPEKYDRLTIDLDDDGPLGPDSARNPDNPGCRDKRSIPFGRSRHHATAGTAVVRTGTLGGGHASVKIASAPNARKSTQPTAKK